jgi:multisubunit Na+/H+ antiporter MnhC subunit
MFGLFNYWLAIIIILIGFYGVIAKKNLLKQAIALGLFQTRRAASRASAWPRSRGAS